MKKKSLLLGLVIMFIQFGQLSAETVININKKTESSAPVPPSRNSSEVISIFCDVYNDAPVDYLNGYWTNQTTEGKDDLDINGDKIIHYKNLNFVGIEFKNPTIDVSEMSHFHLDIQAKSQVNTNDFLKVKILDLGSDNTLGTGDDSFHEIVLTNTELEFDEWYSLDISISELASLTGLSNIAQIIFTSDGAITEIFVDNIYFHDSDTSNPEISEVFLDEFKDLEYLPFGSSNSSAFTVDSETKYEGSASMRFDVPNASDTNGSFAGAIYRDINGGRDLTKFNALTFWAKGSQGAIIDEIGFGQDFIDNKYKANIKDLVISTIWKKYIIPIPDASKLTKELGMLWYLAGPINGFGYTFWMDEIKFEKIDAISELNPSIFYGEIVSVEKYTSEVSNLNNFNQSFLYKEEIINVNSSPEYFNFTSSEQSVASVNKYGEVFVADKGTSIIRAYLNDVIADGYLSVKSLGDFDIAPYQTSRNTSDVISIFSDFYTNEPIDFFNGYWEPFQTTLGANDLIFNGDNFIRYSNLNFVGIQFLNNPIDASEMTHFHMDIKSKYPLNDSDFLKVILFDVGSDNTFDNVNDTSHEILLYNSKLSSEDWYSIDAPISSLYGLKSYSNLAQIVFDSSETLTDLFVDNIYFYKTGTANLNEIELPTINFYPNPAKDELRISSKNKIEKIFIYDVLGKKINTVNVNSYNKSLNISSLKAGLYTVKYYINNKFGNSKFIKK